MGVPNHTLTPMTNTYINKPRKKIRLTLFQRAEGRKRTGEGAGEVLHPVYPQGSVTELGRAEAPRMLSRTLARVPTAQVLPPLATAPRVLISQKAGSQQPHTLIRNVDTLDFFSVNYMESVFFALISQK